MKITTRPDLASLIAGTLLALAAIACELVHVAVPEFIPAASVFLLGVSGGAVVANPSPSVTLASPPSVAAAESPSSPALVAVPPAAAPDAAVTPPAPAAPDVAAAPEIPPLDPAGQSHIVGTAGPDTEIPTGAAFPDPVTP